eukprot:8180258-Alexandrium_andersonii.AAC.1
MQGNKQGSSLTSGGAAPPLERPPKASTTTDIALEDELKDAWIKSAHLALPPRRPNPKPDHAPAWLTGRIDRRITEEVGLGRR